MAVYEPQLLLNNQHTAAVKFNMISTAIMDKLKYTYCIYTLTVPCFIIIKCMNTFNASMTEIHSFYNKNHFEASVLGDFHSL